MLLFTTFPSSEGLVNVGLLIALHAFALEELFCTQIDRVWRMKNARKA